MHFHRIPHRGRTEYVTICQTGHVSFSCHDLYKRCAWHTSHSRTCCLHSGVELSVCREANPHSLHTQRSGLARNCRLESAARGFWRVQPLQNSRGMAPARSNPGGVSKGACGRLVAATREVLQGRCGRPQILAWSSGQLSLDCSRAQESHPLGPTTDA